MDNVYHVHILVDLIFMLIYICRNKPRYEMICTGLPYIEWPVADNGYLQRMAKLRQFWIWKFELNCMPSDWQKPFTADMKCDIVSIGEGKTAIEAMLDIRYITDGVPVYHLDEAEEIIRILKA